MLSLIICSHIVALAIAFGVCNFKNQTNVAAVLEWIIALIFTFWVLSFFIDLMPAMRTKHHGAESGVPQLEIGDTNGGLPRTDMNGDLPTTATGYTNGNRYSNGYMDGNLNRNKYGVASDGYSNANTNATGDGYLGDVPTASDGYANRSGVANEVMGAQDGRYYQETGVHPKPVTPAQNF